jgi:putative transposase
LKYWLWRAVDQTEMVLDALIQSRRDTHTAKCLLCKLLKRQCRAPRIMVTDKLASCCESACVERWLLSNPVGSASAA